MHVSKLTVFSVLCVSWALTAKVALAQDDPAQDAAQSEAMEEQTLALASTETSEAESGPVEEIVVTGSRIRRNAFTSTSPVTVITSERSALAGLLDTADILQSSTIASGQQIDDSSFRVRDRRRPWRQYTVAARLGCPAHPGSW